MTEDRAESDRSAGARRRWPLALGLLVGLWLVAAVALLALGAAAAERGRDELAEVEDRADLADLFEGDTDLLGPARSRFADADRWLSNPLLRPLHLVPVAGRQLRTTTDLVATTDRLLGAAQGTLASVTAAMADGMGSAATRLELLHRLEREVRSLEAEVDAADLGPDDALIGPVARARRQAEARLADVRDGLADARTVLTATRELLTGPSSYLVVAANNAEMRVGSGMFLSMGRVHFADGEIEVGPFQPAVELQLPEAVPLTPEVEQLWGWANPGREWRNLGLTPRFPVNAELAESMWRAGGRPAVDGVMLLDVVGLQHLLRAVGPVDVSGQRVDADGIVSLLMHDQYVGIEGGEDNAERREQLSSVAGAVVDRLGQGEVDVPALVTGLRSSQAARHLMLWSSDSDQQAAWEVAGLAGDLDGRSVAVGVANIGGNKLDQFLDVDVDLRTSSAGADGTEVAIEVRVENRTPAEVADYILGSDREGGYRGVVVAYVPDVARGIEVPGGTVIASGPDGRSFAVGVGIDVPRSEERRVELRFTVPQEVLPELRIVPSARVPAQEWWLDGEPVAEGGRLRRG